MPRATPPAVWTLLCCLLAACQGAATLSPTTTPTATALPTQTATASPTATSTSSPAPPSPTPENPHSLAYRTQSGDSLLSLAARFDVSVADLLAQVHAVYPGLSWLPPDYDGFLYTGLLLRLPKPDEATTPGELPIPDSEVVFSASASDFDPLEYLESSGGALAGQLITTLPSMPQPPGAVLARVAQENSINPRLLLAVLEFHCACVLGQPETDFDVDTILGVTDWQRYGFKRQLVWAVEQLSTGYYGWRTGTITTLTFLDGSSLRLAPTLNAGTVALQYLFAQLYDRETWLAALDPQNGFPALYQTMFGDYWARANQIEPLLKGRLEQPEMVLPFLPGHVWSFSGGPHSVWEKNGPLAALDFTPRSEKLDCEVSGEWVVAAASGLVVRAGPGVIVQDLDGDGDENTGWVILYVHVSIVKPTVTVGTWLEAGQLLGHPSCEGGPSTSAHLHIGRKYNGEWMLAGGPLPFVLSGWVAAYGESPYSGTLSKDGVTISACECASSASYIMRPPDD